MSIHLPINAVNDKSGEGDSKEKPSGINRGKQRSKTAFEFAEFIKNSLRKNEKTNLTEDVLKTSIRKRKKSIEENNAALNLQIVSLNSNTKIEYEQNHSNSSLKNIKPKAESREKSTNNRSSRFDSKTASFQMSENKDAIQELMKEHDVKNSSSKTEKYAAIKNFEHDADSIGKKQKWTKSFEDFTKELINEKIFKSSFIDFMTKFDAVSSPVLNTLKNLQTMYQIPINSLSEILNNLSYKKINDTFFLNLQLYPEELGKIELFMRKDGNDIVGTAIVANEEAKAVFMKDMDMLSDYFQEKGYNFKGIDVEIGNSSSYEDDSFNEFMNTSINNTVSYSNNDGRINENMNNPVMPIYRLGKYVNYKV